MIPSGDFIPVAEETGLIVPLGEGALRDACAAAARWPEHIKVAVNLSPAQFDRGNLVQATVSAFTAARLAPSRLQLEITESVLLMESRENLVTLHRLHELGVRTVLDDFGTGYSSLSYLRSFPFDKLKIDRSFVDSLSPDNGSAAIIRAIADLGRNLGMAVTAEGVETAEQLDVVRNEGCTEVQGYIISPPLPGAAIPDLLRRLAPDEAVRRPPLAISA